ncbi:MAG: hypothetical protein EOP56_05745 [Sphingobacteriales bacterium]|nr:MAG: hypothetical protein EOP56_05745 [Sphingobacteriales bacterium]
MGHFVYFPNVVPGRGSKKMEVAKTEEGNADVYTFFIQEMERVVKGKPAIASSPLANKNLRMFSPTYYLDKDGQLCRKMVAHRTIPPDSPLTASQLKKIERLLKSGMPEN